MNILYFTIPFALLLGALFAAGFIWVVRSDQYEDLETPAVRILFEDSKSNSILEENTK